MTNIHQLVWPERGPAIAAGEDAGPRVSAEVLILPCVRRERLEADVRPIQSGLHCQTLRTADCAS
ncbi:hypothetical protein [Aureimonas sp. ME7]|uniref:hypothetical protein n=1 Tax=Aureimonas sp. ME7 TaxID=2744252 RepID=UPI0015F733F1|nr:hypothetical protein [Aureimonas sp. ME7]